MPSIKTATLASPTRLTPSDELADHWFVFDADTARFLREMGGDVLRARTFASDYESLNRFDELADAVVAMFKARADSQLASYRMPMKPQPE